MINVLVVDDEVPIRQWLEFCINKIEGYHVAGTAANGAEGYSIFRKTHPEIVITDIRMPVMDGLEMLKMIQNINPAVYSAVLTSHEDFEYARQAMKTGASEYILKTEITEESLRQTLENGRQMIWGSPQEGMQKSVEDISNRNHYLRSLAMNHHAASVSESVLKEYGILLEKGDYLAMDILYHQEGPLRPDLPEDGILPNAIKVPLDLDHVLILGNISRNAPPNESLRIQAIQAYCRAIQQQIPCKIGCSDIYGSLNRLGAAILQARDRVNLSFYNTRETLFFNQPTGKYTLSNGEKYKIRFSKELVNQNYRKALEIKDEMMAQVRAEEISDPDYVKELYLFFLTSLYHITKDDVEKVEAQIAAFSQEMMNAQSLDELDLVMKRGFEKYGSRSISGQEYSASVRGAVAYMEAHYAESLNLSDVAEHVSLSPEYLSRLFKEETGVKFVVYLNNLRLKHALYLLETTNLKVYEVAEQVGYSNLSYFSTVFKKNFGQNPFDYKNSCRNSE